jgi:hypothetical protein
MDVRILHTSVDGPIAFSVSINAIPIPGAVWLLGSGLVALVGLRKKFRGKNGSDMR